MKPYRRIAAALLVLGLFAALLAGCSNAKEDYATEVNDILLPLGQDLQSLGPELSKSQPADAAMLISGATGSIDAAVAKLGQLNPPEGLESVQQDLIAALNGLADDLGKVGDAAESGNLGKLRDAALALPAAAASFDDKLTEIEQEANDAGVDFGSTGSG